MRLAEKYSVPQQLALLYDFLNSADIRTYVEKGQQHVPSDEWETPSQFAAWMRDRGLIKRNETVAPTDFRRAHELRSALRSYLQIAPESRAAAREQKELVNRVSRDYPLVVHIDDCGVVKLKPETGTSGLGLVMAQFLSLAESSHLDRLKMCSSDECRWVFFDRSKPGNRRWCSSALCGNRRKTRDYRMRVKQDAPGGAKAGPRRR